MYVSFPGRSSPRKGLNSFGYDRADFSSSGAQPLVFVFTDRQAHGELGGPEASPVGGAGRGGTSAPSWGCSARLRLDCFASVLTAEGGVVRNLSLIWRFGAWPEANECSPIGCIIDGLVVNF